MLSMQSCFLLGTQEGLCLAGFFGIESTLFFNLIYMVYNYKSAETIGLKRFGGMGKKKEEGC